MATVSGVLTRLCWLSALCACATAGGARTQRELPQASVTISPRFHAQVLQKLAIYVVDNSGRLGYGAVLHQVENEIMSAALRRGYVLAARSDLRDVDSERMLAGRMVTEAAMSRSARALGASGILIVTVDRAVSFPYQPAASIGGIVVLRSPEQQLATEAIITARMVDAELGEILWLAMAHRVSTTSPREPDLTTLVNAAEMIGRALPSLGEGSVGPPPRSRPRSQALAAGCDTARIDRIAVYVHDRSHQVPSRGTLRLAEHAVMARALRAGYTIAARSDMESIEQELHLQSSLAVDRTIAREGRLLGVHGVLILSVDALRIEPHPRLLSQMRVESAVSARIVSTCGARVVWVASHGREQRIEVGAREPGEAFPAILADELAQKIPHAPLRFGGNH